MRMTYQLVSGSGSFGMPEGADVEHGTKAQAAAMLERWRYVHRKCGSEEKDAALLAWYGNLDDVTDAYPDYEIKAGPRGGVRWGRC